MGSRARIIETKQGSLQIIQDGARNRYPVNVGSTASSAQNFGLLHFGSTSGAKEFAVDAPEPGVRLYLSCTAATTVNTCTVRFSADNSVTLDGSSDEQALQFVRGGAGAVVVGRSASKWSLVSSLSGSTEISVTT